MNKIICCDGPPGSLPSGSLYCEKIGSWLVLHGHEALILADCLAVHSFNICRHGLTICRHLR